MLRDRNLLQMINTARTRAGYAPLACLPAGTPGDPDDCVIARALTDIDSTIKVHGAQIDVKAEFAAIIQESFGGEQIEALVEGTGAAGIKMPRETVEWIQNFDALSRPRLIDPETPLSTLDPRLSELPAKARAKVLAVLRT